MSIRYSTDEAWAFVESGHTGILTTLRRDGAPISLPTWFVVLDRTICLSTPPRTSKVSRIRRDPRAAFLVERGESWAELAAVHLSGALSVVEDQATRERVLEQLDQKYAAHRMPAGAVPAAVAQRYQDRTVLRMSTDRVLSWDNSRIKRKA